MVKVIGKGGEVSMDVGLKSPIHLGGVRLPGGRESEGGGVMMGVVLEVVNKFQPPVILVDVPLKFLPASGGGLWYE